MSKKGIVNKALYGKDNKDDFTNIMLPPTRKKQFLYILKNNWMNLFYLNLIVFIFFLPFIAYYAMSTIYISKIVSSLESKDYLLQLFPISCFQYLPLAFLLIIGFIGASGANFVIRKMLFDEVIDFKNDFKKGIKYSWKQYAFLGFVLGLILLINNYASQYVLLLGLDPFIAIVLYVLVLIVFIILLISIMYMANLSTLYVMNNFMLIKSGLLLSIKELPRNILVFAASFLPIFIWVSFSYIFVKIITPILLIIFGFSLILLAFCELSMFSFDKYINEKSYPDFYRKGLRENG